MTPQSQLKSISKGAIFSFFGSGTFFVLNYLLLYIISRFSDTGVVGLLFISLNLINIMAILSRQGLSEGILRYVSVNNGILDAPRVKGVFAFSILYVLFVSSVVSIILFVNSQLIAGILSKPSLAILIKIFAICLPFIAIFKIFMSVFQGLQEIKYIALFQGILLPALLITIYLLAYLVGGARFIGLGISYIGAYFIVIVFAAIKIKSIFKGKIIVKAKDCMELLAFSFPLTFVGLLSLASGQIDALILGWYKNAQEVGLFVITFNLSLVCSAFLSLINYIFAPVTANLHGQNDIKTLEEVVKTVTRWILMLSLPIYFIFIINANMILQIFGKEYSAGYYPLLLLCSAQLFYAVGGLSAVLLPMIGKSYFAFFNSFIFLFLNAIFDILLVPLYGMMGAALGFSASLFIISLITMLQIYFILKIHQFSLKLLLPIICMAAIFVIGYLNKGMIYSNILYVFMFSILGISIYIGIMMHFIQKNDKEILKYIMHGSIGKVKNALFHIK